MPAPIVPPAPTRFSTTTGWPISCDSGSHTMRATMSPVEPAENGMITRIDFAGQVWARAPRDNTGAERAAPRRDRCRRRVWSMKLSRAASSVHLDAGRLDQRDALIDLFPDQRIERSGRDRHRIDP